MRTCNALNRLAAARPRITQRTGNVVDAAQEQYLLRQILAVPPAPERARARTFRVPHPSRAGLLASGLAVTAVAVSAAVVLATGTAPLPTSGTTPVPGGSRTAAQSPSSGRSAREILLAYASAAAREPATTGKYWWVHSKFTSGFADTVDTWMMRNGTNWVRAVKTHDRVIQLRRAGPGWELESIGMVGMAPSLRTLTGGKCTGSACLKRLLKSEEQGSRPANPGPESAENNPKWPGSVTFGQLQRLPTNPVALKAWVVAFDRNYNQANNPGLVIPADAGVYTCLSNLIGDLPVPPRVRAAAFRVLATLPGIKAIDGGQALQFDFGGRAWATFAVDFTASGVHTLTSAPEYIDPGKSLRTRVYGWSVTAQWTNHLPK